MQLRCLCIILNAALAGVSCGPSATSGGFDSPNSAAKMYAIEQAARTNDASAMSRIVAELDSDDPAVRLMAIQTLERLTGETYGYQHSDPPERRQAAIDRWVEATEREGSLNRPVDTVEVADEIQ